MPVPQPIDLHGQELDLVPVCQLIDAFAEIRSNPGELRCENRRFRDYVSAANDPFGISSPAWK